jgi:hypothetical protein
MKALLKCIDGPNKGLEFPVDEKGIVIGRDSAIAGIVVDWESVSPTHVKVFFAPDGKIILHDINTAGGTYIIDESGERKRITEDVELAENQEFSIGDDVCTFKVKYLELRKAVSARETRTEFKTLTFPNTPEGQQEKISALQTAASEGWTVVSETVKEGEFRGGLACCLAIIFWPLTFLVGHKTGEIVLTLKREVQV